MRTIKFRAWHKEVKKMFPVRMFDFKQNGELDHIRIIDCVQISEDNFDFDFPKLKKGDFKLMQFTGLHDSKGKEIYEGDICKYLDDSDTNQIGEVSYDGEVTAMYGLSAVGGDEEGNNDIILHVDYEIEVIGNIYENPNLLEK